MSANLFEELIDLHKTAVSSDSGNPLGIVTSDNKFGFFHTSLDELSEIYVKITDYFGSNNKHLSTLNTNIMNAVNASANKSVLLLSAFSEKDQIFYYAFLTLSYLIEYGQGTFSKSDLILSRYTDDQWLQVQSNLSEEDTIAKDPDLYIQDIVDYVAEQDYSDYIGTTSILNIVTNNKDDQEESVDDNISLWKWGEGADDTGSLYIGDIHFSIPPTSMHFSVTNQNMSLPTVRTLGDPVLSANNEYCRVDITLFFSGIDAVNEQLRPLNAMAHYLPFTTVQNTSIYRAWVGRDSEAEDTIEMDLEQKMFRPLPAYIKNISVSTVPGYPDSFQATITLTEFNNTPYGVGFKFWRNEAEAAEESRVAGIKHSLDSTILKVNHGQDDVTRVDVLDSTNTVHHFKTQDKLSDIPSQSNVYTTEYPQESTPYKNQYRHILYEHAVLRNKEALENNPTKFWPKYKGNDETFYLSYHSPKRFHTIQSVYESRVNNLVYTYMLIRKTLLNIQRKDEDELKELYTTAVKDTTILYQILANSISWVKDVEELKNNIQNSLAVVIQDLASKDILSNYITSENNSYTIKGIVAESETEEGYIQGDTIVFSSDDKFIEDGKITSLGQAVIEAIMSLPQYFETDEQSTAYVSSLDDFILPMEVTKDEPFAAFGIDFLDTPYNYQRVQLGFGWFDEADTQDFYAQSQENMYNLLATGNHAEGEVTYAFKSVLQSVSYSFSNNTAPLYLTSASTPTFQHLGIPSATASIVFRTRDENILKIIQDMRASTRELGRAMAEGNNSLLNLGAIQIVNSEDQTSPHILNTLGMREVSIQHIDIKNIDNYPGWQEVSIDVIANTQNIRLLEKLNLASPDEIEHLSYLTESLFPVHRINMFALQDPEKLSKAAVRKIEALKKEVKRLRNQGNAVHSSYQFDGASLTRSNDTRYNIQHTIEAMHGIAIEDLSKRFGVTDSFSSYIYWDDESEQYKVSLKFKEQLVEDTYNDMLSPFITRILKIMKDVREWENTYESKNKVYSLEASLKETYESTINTVVYTIASLIRTTPLKIIDTGPSLFYPLVGMPTDFSEQTIFLEFIVLASQLKGKTYSILKRQDFRTFLSIDGVTPADEVTAVLSTLAANKLTVDTLEIEQEQKNELNSKIDETIEAVSSLNNENTYFNDEDSNLALINKISQTVTPTYPDLDIWHGNSEAIDTNTGIRLRGPAYPFVDQDLDLDVIEMSKVTGSLKLSTYAQFAGIATGNFELYYKKIREAMGYPSYAYNEEEYDGEVIEVGEYSYRAEDVDNGAVTADTVALTVIENNGAALNMEELTRLINSTGADHILPEYMKENGEFSFNKTFSPYLSVKEDVADLQEKVANSEGTSNPLADIKAGPSKTALMQLMTSTAMIDYMSSILHAAALVGGDDKETLQSNVKSLYTTMMQDGLTTEDYTSLLNKVLNSGGEISVQTGTASDGNSMLVSALLQKRDRALRMATMASNDDPQAFLEYFGIGNVDSEAQRQELLKKFSNSYQYKRKGTMERAFPTFKIFFIEEDSNSWKAFDDFYSYDAASEISIVESKHAASKTAILKLSNVTNVLTNDIYTGVTTEGKKATPAYKLSLKEGTQIMILLGYGPDYRHLRMKFKGAITNINPGSILEVTAQSWGAGLLNQVGSSGGTEYSALSGATSLGAAVIDILAQTPGLKHLGRWEVREMDSDEKSIVSESSMKKAYWARLLAGLAGPLTDLLSVDTDITSILRELPHTTEQLREARRTNNVLVQAFGNSLYDNIIINNTNPSGYGLFNYIERVGEWVTDLSTPFDGKGFKWTVFRQNAWDALNEVALFLGDYIVTTLPFNEGNGLFAQPPRETLYFGPRDGLYKASSNIPDADVEYILKQLLDSDGMFSQENKDTDQSQETLLSMGKRLLAKSLLSISSKFKPYSSPVYISTSGDLLDYYFNNYTGLYGEYVKAIEAQGFSKVGAALRDGVAVFKKSIMKDQRFGTEVVSAQVQDMLKKDMPYHIIHQVVLNDIEQEYLELGSSNHQYTYTKTDREYIAALRSGDLTDPWKYDKEFRKQHVGNSNSIFYWLFYSYSRTDAGRSARLDSFNKLFSSIDEAIKQDTMYYLENYVEIKKNSPATFAELDLEYAIQNTQGDIATFLYKPTVNFHGVNSYEDIIQNNIVATSDGMYNHVEVLYGNKVDPHDDSANAKNRAQAWISYDQDPDFLRSYQVYMKNLDPSIFSDTWDARSYISAANEETKKNSMLTQHAIAQQVLMNVMKPMYQGTMTVLGNPNIKPWDVVHIHDDSIGMYGPVEVEQVVNTFSATGGYTTTFVPNLYVNYKDSSRALDDLLISMQNTIDVIGYIGASLRQGGRYSRYRIYRKLTRESAIENFLEKKGIAQLLGKAGIADVEDLLTVTNNKIKFTEKAEKLLTVQQKITIGSLNELNGAYKELSGILTKISKRSATTFTAEDRKLLRELTELLYKKGAISKDSANSFWKLLSSSIDDVAAPSALQRLNALKSSIPKSFAKGSSFFDDGIQLFTKKAVARSTLVKTVAKYANWVGWALFAYDIVKTGWEMFETYAKGKISLAGIIAGENQLTWIPLEYQGKPFTAGLEGITGTPRDASTVLWGGLKGDNSGANRSISVINLLFENGQLFK